MSHWSIRLHIRIADVGVAKLLPTLDPLNYQVKSVCRTSLPTPKYNVTDFIKFL